MVGASIIAGLLSFAVAGGASWRVRRELAPTTGLLISVAIALGVMAACQDLLRRTEIDWNSVRAVIPVALAQGRPIYGYGGTGALWCNIYPPLGHLLYTPIALMRTPDAAIHLGQAMAAVWVVGSLAVLGTSAAPGRRIWGGLVGLLLAITSVAWMGGIPLADVALFIHIDAPAIGLAVLACASLLWLQERQAWWRFIPPALPPALLAAAAVMCKQTMGGVGLVLFAWCAWRQGARAAGVFAGSFALALGVMAGVAVLAFGGQSLWHSILVVPSKHEFPGGFSDSLVAAIKDYLRLMFPLNLLAVTALALAWKTPARSTVLLLALIALVQAPLGMLGEMKFGGGPNNLAISGIFLAAILLVAVAEGLRAPSGKLRQFALAVIGLCLIGNLIVAARAMQQEGTIGPTQHQLAFEKIRAEPGRYYFPWLPLSHLMAEGRETHQSWGVLDRVMAGEDPDEAWFRKYVPPEAQVIGFKDRPDRFGVVYLRLRGEFPIPVQVEGLPGWVCFGKSNARETADQRR